MAHQPASSLDKLIAVLGKKLTLTGGEELKLTGTEIADILWLILQRQESAETTPAVVPSPPKDDTIDIPPTSTQLFSDNNPTPLVQKSPSVGVHHSGKSPPSVNPSHSDKPSRDSNTLPIKTPDANSLRDAPAIIRALRPLVQRIPVGRETILDEQATAERIAEEQNIPIPVLKSAQELAFDLALVVDESNSMIFWRQTIEELQQLLKKSGVFRDVQIWGLVTDNQEEIYLQRGIGNKAHHRRCSPCELVDSGGRRLILVVSDCVSPIWHDGKALSVLEIWVKQNAVAIVQMLPESMWLRTGLTLGAKVQLGNSILGAANQRLSIKEVLLWNDINFDRGIKVPVLTLEPDMVETWSEMLVGKGTIGAGGFVFTPPPKPQKHRTRSVKDAEPKNLPSQEFETKENLTSEERVYRFRMTASPMARNLASLLSSAPVITLPVVRIIQKTLLSRSRQIHVAEVFLGGILKPLSSITPKTNPDGVEYIFIDDDKDKKIRDLLLENSPRTDSLQVIDAVSKYFAENIGNKSLKEFYALLKKPKELDAAVEEAKTEKKEALDSFDSKRFAEITTKILKRLGGAYARFANEVESAFSGGETELGTPPPSEKPPRLVEFTFEVATIIIEDDTETLPDINLQPFEFEVARIEVNPVNNLELVKEMVFTKTEEHLNSVQLLVLKGALANKNYEEISQAMPGRGASPTYLANNIGPNLWKVLSEVFGEKVSKKTVKKVIEQWAARHALTIHRYQQQATGFIEVLGNGVQLEMVSIPGGSFMMGSPEEELEHSNDESPQHEVAIKAFCLGKYQVTQAQWQAVASFPQVSRELKPNPSRFQGANRPVEQVSWDDAVEFCSRLSQYTGRPYRLPSEAEWEYACRAGTTTPFHFGETITTDLANYNGTDNEKIKRPGFYGQGPKGICREETTEVGSFGVANDFGLYDMHGNLREWCADNWHNNYEGAPTDGSAWLSDNDNQVRMLRGGSWFALPALCRSAFRNYLDADDRFNGYGFRVACSAA